MTSVVQHATESKEKHHIMEARVLMLPLLSVLVVALSAYSVNAIGVESGQGHSLNTAGDGGVTSAAMSMHHRYDADDAIDNANGPKRNADGELGLQMNRGAASLSTTGSFTLSAGTQGDKGEEEHLML